MSFKDLRNQELSELVERVKTGDRKVILDAWKEARNNGDDFLSERLRYALCGGERPQQSKPEEPQQSNYANPLLKKVISLYKETERKPSEFMAYA